MNVSIGDNNEPTRTEGDKNSFVTQGFLCPRGVADLKRARSNHRILCPQVRRDPKPEGSFRRVSWLEAIDILATKLKHVITNFGSDSALHLDYSGNQGLLTLHFPQRLFYALGLAETDYTICSASGHHGLSLHYGLSYGVEPDELLDMKLIVYWGLNAAVSAPHIHALARKSRERGGSLVAIDPRQSETVGTADLWIQPRPGSDVALAYGVMKHLIENNLVDSDFILKYTHGFDFLKQEVSKWSAESVEQYTGLKWNSVTELAELYARLKPSATMIGLGMQKSIHGSESVRAISLLPALVGRHRGFYYVNSKGYDIDIPYLSGQSLAKRKTKIVSQVALGRHLKEGEFKFVYVYNMNPAETLPNQRAVREGLSRSDVFVVVHDTHWSETAKRADLVLPAATFLEKDDVVVSYSHRYVRKSNKVMEPLGESKSELWVMTQLAEKLNLKEDWLYEDPWKAINRALRNAFEDGTPADLQKGKTLKLRVRPRDQYQTPSGKIEFYATGAEALGATPLPKQGSLPVAEGLILLNNAVSKYTHTQFRDVYGPMPSTVLMNPEDAKANGVHEGDAVQLSNEFGTIRLQTHISDSVPKGVLWSPRECEDLDGEPQNNVVPDTTQKLGGGSTFNTTIVKIRK
jgi:anaerobic selenocysteine-containing dehydrogenase